MLYAAETRQVCPSNWLSLIRITSQGSERSLVMSSFFWVRSRMGPRMTFYEHPRGCQGWENTPHKGGWGEEDWLGRTLRKNKVVMSWFLTGSTLQRDYKGRCCKCRLQVCACRLRPSHFLKTMTSIPIPLSGETERPLMGLCLSRTDLDARVPCSRGMLNFILTTQNKDWEMRWKCLPHMKEALSSIPASHKNKRQNPPNNNKTTCQ